MANASFSWGPNLGHLPNRSTLQKPQHRQQEGERLRAKVRQLQERNKRLQRRLQRQRQMRTVAEVVESVRVHVSPCVAALVEAQLRMSNVSRLARDGAATTKPWL
ncbi:hypothetical protein ISCGN_013907 [Ixodes scapularis]